MLNTDARAAAWITWCTALAGDSRLRAQDAAMLTAYKTKLGSAPTSQREDLDVIRLHKDVFMNKIRRAGP